MLYAYDKIFVIHHPYAMDRFLIGLRICQGDRFFLPNGRKVPEYKMYLPKNLNPWGFEGETQKVILQFFKESETCSLYPYPQKFDIYPVERSVPGKKYGERIYIKDLAADVEQGFYFPLSVHIDSYFISDIIDNRWSNWFRNFIPFPNGGLISGAIFLHVSEMDLVRKPYYVIKNHTGVYYSSSKTICSYPMLAKQFSTEEQAFRFACRLSSGLSEKGFEIIEVASEPTDVLWTY